MPYAQSTMRNGCGSESNRPINRKADVRYEATSHAHCCCNSTDRKSTRLNSSHSQISYAVFCLKKQKLVDGRLPIPVGRGAVRYRQFLRDSLQRCPLRRLLTVGPAVPLLGIPLESHTVPGYTL